MEDFDFKVLIAGGITSIVISILKRFFSPSKTQIAFIAIAISFIVASVYTLLNNGLDWSEYVNNIINVYGSSQIIYWGVLKTLELDIRIEGK